MGSLRSGLVTLTVAGVLGVMAAAGCSADGSSSVADDTTPTEPTTPGSQLPPASSAPGEVEAGKPPPKDAGKDSTVDAGPPPPVAGTACSVIDEIKKKKCGACGEQATICLGTGGDAGGGKWSDYGACENELTGGCIPGTTTNEGCGNCGTRTRTCSQYCAYTFTGCKGEPVNACVPGAVDLSSAGCAGADTYHQRTCGAACTYGNFGLTCDAPPTSITVGPTIGSVTSTIVTLSSAQTAPRLGSFCPTATLAAATLTPYQYIKVVNPLAKAVTVSVYNSLAPGGVVFPTIMASYKAATPATDVARKACVKGVNDFGNDLLTGDSDFASLDDDDGNAVTIPASGTVTIYVAAYNKYNAANPALSTGKVKLSVRLEQIAP